MSFHVPEHLRLRIPKDLPYYSAPGELYGVFALPRQGGKRILRVIATDGADTPDQPQVAIGWEHVSVSVSKHYRGGPTAPRLPTWDEMCEVKSLFWDPEDVVVQFHPRASEYVDNYFVLHLWRNWREPFPTPDPILVGVLK